MPWITQDISLQAAERIETANTTSETTGSRQESKPESREPQTNTANAALIKAAMPWLLLSPEQQAALAGMPDEEKRIIAIKQLELEAHKANQRPKQAIPDARKLNTTNRLGRPETPHENGRESAEKGREATEQQQRQQNRRRRRPDFRRTVRSWNRYNQIAAERIVAHICRRRRCFESVRNMAKACKIKLNRCRRLLLWLVNNGILEAEHRQHQTTIYTVAKGNQMIMPAVLDDLGLTPRQMSVARILLRFGIIRNKYLWA